MMISNEIIDNDIIRDKETFKIYRFIGNCVNTSKCSHGHEMVTYSDPYGQGAIFVMDRTEFVNRFEKNHKEYDIPKAIIAGGRNFIPEDKHFKWLDRVIETTRPKTIICGMASGADLFGYIYAKTLGINVEEYPANWKEHGNNAGPIRNQQMADNADLCILFPGGRGTRNMEETAAFLGMPIYKYTDKEGEK